jgi:hypothetical protein
MQREDILDRYRHLRAISTRHHSAALGCLARPAILQQAKRLGLAYAQALVAESEEEMTLIFDLAIHTAKSGRSRAIDRYAKAVPLSGGSDEARALDAICGARFSVWRIERHHEIAGLIVTDVLRDSKCPSENTQLELLNFLSISRMEASLRNARALRVRFSKSLARRRQRLIQARVRSTTQRLGRILKPCTVSERLTISTESCGRAFANAWRNFDP